MEDPKLKRIKMKEWWNEMKEKGHWKQWDTYEDWEARDKPKKKNENK